MFLANLSSSAILLIFVLYSVELFSTFALSSCQGFLICNWISLSKNLKSRNSGSVLTLPAAPHITKFWPLRWHITFLATIALTTLTDIWNGSVHLTVRVGSGSEPENFPLSPFPWHPPPPQGTLPPPPPKWNMMGDENGVDRIPCLPAAWAGSQITPMSMGCEALNSSVVVPIRNWKDGFWVWNSKNCFLTPLGFLFCNKCSWNSSVHHHTFHLSSPEVGGPLICSANR